MGLLGRFGGKHGTVVAFGSHFCTCDVLGSVSVFLFLIFVSVFLFVFLVVLGVNAVQLGLLGRFWGKHCIYRFRFTLLYC